MKTTLINNIEIAKSQTPLSGEMAVDDCSRLTEVVNNGNQSQLKIHYSLVGGEAKFHLPSMHLTVEASLPLICQRCLEPMQLDLSLAYDYVVSESEPEEIEGDDNVDWVETSREMDVNELIEDELLIALPLAPTHEQKCKPLKLESGEKHNPFAALKGLVKGD